MESKDPHNAVELPAPTAWPTVAAFGVSLVCAGLVTHMAVTVLGFALVVAGGIGWFRDCLPVAQHVHVPIEGLEAKVRPVKLVVKHLKIGEQAHRASLPLEIYPYSAGFYGGIAGGIAMAVIATAYGIWQYGSPWYTINILAASAVAYLADADLETLKAFHLVPFLVASFIHGVTSILVGLLYGVMLPMMPRRPLLLGGVLAPILWTGLLWASLRVINPVLDQRIDWRAFIVSQIGFGVACGFVVARFERISTFQSEHFLARAGFEAAGLEGEEKER